jgi:hypothetical protein
MLLYGPPAHVARRVHLTLKRLHSLVPPRIASAVIQTLWNGWCTARRFQDQSHANDRCWLGCGAGAHDSIEHYCRCPVALGVLARTLRIEISPRQALAVWLLAHDALLEDEVLALTSLYVYAIYRTTNHYRHTRRTSPTWAADSIKQHIIQGCQGNERLMQWLDCRWDRPVTRIASHSANLSSIARAPRQRPIPTAKAKAKAKARAKRRSNAQSARVHVRPAINATDVHTW